MQQEDRQFITALARGLEVLAAFRPGEGTLSNQELARRTGLPKSTVSRLSHTLTRLGYLQQDGDGGQYRLGLALLALGTAALAGYDVRASAAPLMREFALANNVSVSLALCDGSDMVYLETCRSQARVSVQLSTGSRVPLATTAIGRAYFAGLPQAEREALLPLLAARHGADWPALETRLRQACADYRLRGYTASFGEYEPDVMAVGIHLPALLPGQPAMALNASGPAFAFDQTAMREAVAPALRALRLRIVPMPA
ncbi:IclR family transcriptional regulator [Chromobacterium sp. ATCC 53434]|uniref:IclR family transcriptional regulator n=1 Tax=Chromobacterium sp. (strain ATCC 53434 / SC 14030) TaxID=2059672 RepID=UPI000C75BF03|nr:IclR family transcriptional regulator [Chromobacterium sp. ATCC 53434]AUH49644.1 IclR family transcriptional regulator [Chromobacterium sp. ATCC 53434]